MCWFLFSEKTKRYEVNSIDVMTIILLPIERANVPVASYLGISQLFGAAKFQSAPRANNPRYATVLDGK